MLPNCKCLANDLLKLSEISWPRGSGIGVLGHCANNRAWSHQGKDSIGPGTGKGRCVRDDHSASAFTLFWRFIREREGGEFSSLLMEPHRKRISVLGADPGRRRSFFILGYLWCCSLPLISSHPFRNRIDWVAVQQRDSLNHNTQCAPIARALADLRRNERVA